MPTILYKNDQNISPDDAMKIAVYAEHVSTVTTRTLGREFDVL
ncbi:hypothetical protein [Rhizobium ruizarguesonis]|nr:hypothetical protein [Rhizobium ruizarguesonis]